MRQTKSFEGQNRVLCETFLNLEEKKEKEEKERERKRKKRERERERKREKPLRALETK